VCGWIEFGDEWFRDELGHGAGKFDGAEACDGFAHGGLVLDDAATGAVQVAEVDKAEVSVVQGVVVEAGSGAAVDVVLAAADGEA
jgi:hypothetical protein